MNIARTDSNDSMQRPAPSTTHSSGVSTRCTGTPASRPIRVGEAAQHAATADELDALDEKILCQLGWRLREAGEHRVDHRRDDLVDRFADLFGSEHDGLRQPTHQLAAADLGANFVFGCAPPNPSTILMSSAVRSPIAMP